MFRRSTAVAVVVSFAVAARPAAAQFGNNLVQNPGAEAGAGSSSGAVVAVPSWTTIGNATAVTYGASGFPRAADPGPPTRGTNFFAGGPSNAGSQLSQTLNLGGFGISSLINAGSVTYTVSAYLGGFGTQNDNATFTARFLDGSATPLLVGMQRLGPVFAADRNNVTGLLVQSATGVLPAGTASVQFVLDFTRAGGGYNDGYADDVSFVLANTAQSTVPEPATVALLGAGLLGVAGIARRRRSA